MWTERRREARRMVAITCSLFLGVIAFLWPGGPNILMLLGVTILFMTALFDVDKVEVDHGERP